MRHSIILGIFCFLQLLGCSDSIEYPNQADFTHSLVKEEVVRIPIGNSTPIDPSKYFLLEEGDKEFLFLYNRPVRQIEIYDMKKLELASKISIPSEGPTAPDYPESFFPVNGDSIIIFSPKTCTANLYDGDGVFLEKFSWVTDEAVLKNPDKYYQSHVFITYNNWPHKSGQRIYLPTVPLGRFNDPEGYEKGTVTQIMDWENGEVEYVFGYPDLYKDNNYSHLTIHHFRTKGHDNLFVHGFTADPYVTVTDYDGLRERKLCTSRYIEPPLEIFGSIKNTTGDQFDKYRAESPMYRAILHDKHRGIYYRFVVGEQNLEASFVNREQSAAKFSVILMNEDFEVIGETLLSDNTYNYMFGFVGKKGLYLSTSHAMNENVDENHLEFGVFVPAPSS